MTRLYSIALCAFFCLSYANGYSQTVDIKFTIGALRAPVISGDEVDDLTAAKRIQVILEGEVDKNCLLFIGPNYTPCSEVQAKVPYTITKTEDTRPDIVMTPPYEIYVLNGTDESKKIPVGNTSEASPEEPKKDAVDLGGAPLVWRDALLLGRAVEEEKYTVIIDILKKYDLVGSMTDYNSFIAGTNPYLKAVLPEEMPEGAPDAYLTTDVSSTGIELPPIFDATTALDALGTLIAERLIDELNVAYLDRFRTALNTTDLPTLLPNTSSILLSLGQSYEVNYKLLLPSLRKTLDEDLTNLPSNGKQLLYDRRDDFTRLSNVTIDDYVLLFTSLQVIEEAINQDEPEDIIDHFLTTDYGLGDSLQSDLHSWLQFGALMSNQLRQAPSAGRWIKKNQLQQFVNSPSLSYLFFGLFIELEETKLSDLPVNNNSIYSLLYSDVQGQAYIRLLYDMLTLVADISDIYGKINPETKKEDKLVIYSTIIERLLSIYDDLPNEILDNIGNTSALQMTQKCLAMYQHIANKDYVAAATVLSTLLEMPNLDSDLTRFLFKYLPFAQALIDADNKDEILAALREAADPVGSYRHKRHYPVTVSLSAFPGATFGREQHQMGINNNTAINNFGFTAPFGVALSVFGSTVPEEPSGSLTIFAPILDVGAITAFRINSGSADLPEVEWENFLAPGLILQYGFPRSPLSIHFGVQYGPEIKDFSTGEQARLPRLNLGLSADLHLYSIFNKAHN